MRIGSRWRGAWSWVTVLVAALSAAGVQAQEKYPARPITIINPYAPGSSMDIMARAIGRQFQEAWGQPVVVNSIAGASGVVGMTALMRATPDGHTLAFTPLVPVVVQPHLNKDSKVNPDTVEAVCGITENILGILVAANSPLRTVADLVAATRTKPLSFGSPGPNSAPFLGVDELARKQKVSFVHVPYKGDAASLVDLQAGQLDFAAIVAASAGPIVASGKGRLLAVMSNRRHPGYPDVPTLVEAGFDVTQLSYAGLFAPKGLPERVRQQLDEACTRLVAAPSFREVAVQAQQVIAHQPQSAFDRKVREEFQRQGAALKAAGAL